MKRRYHTLVVRDEDGRWSPQFGDYDRECVEQEKRDEYSGQRTRILTTASDQASINAAVAALNKGATQ